MACECAFRKELEKAFERESNLDYTENLLKEIVAKIEEAHEVLDVEKDRYKQTINNLLYGMDNIKEAPKTLRKERRKRWGK